MGQLRRWRVWVCSALVLGGVPLGAPADTSTWTQSSGNWSNAPSWDPIGMPNGATADVHVLSGGNVSVDGDYTIRSITIDPSGGLLVNEGKRLTLSGDGLNDGLLTLKTNATLGVQGNVTISGAGSIHAFAAAMRGASSADDTLTLNQGLSSVQVSIVDLAMVNNDRIKADTLTLTRALLSNQLALTANTLTLDSATLTNTGTMTVASVILKNSTLAGGTLPRNTVGPVTVQGDSILDGSSPLTLATSVNVSGGQSLTLRGQLTNNGSITGAGSSALPAILRVAGDVPVDGDGTLDLSGSTRMTGAGSNDGLTIGPSQRLYSVYADGAAPSVEVPVTNKGVINILGPSTPAPNPTFSNTSVRNTSTISLSGAASLSHTVVNNEGGHLSLAHGASLTLIDSSVVGGAWSGDSSCTIQFVGHNVLDGGLATAFFPFALSIGNATVELKNRLKIAGSVLLANPSSAAADAAVLQIDGEESLPEVQFASPNLNRITAGAGGQLTFSSGISTTPGSSGVIEVRLVNTRTIDANGGTITFLGGDVNNQGAILARNGGRVVIQETTLRSSSGSLSIDATSSAVIRNTTVSGSLQGTGAIRIQGNVAFAGMNGTSYTLDIDPGGVLDLQQSPSFANAGTIRLNDDGAPGSATTLRLPGGLYSGAPGVIIFNTAGNNQITLPPGYGGITLPAGQRLLVPAGASGAVRAPLQNFGVIENHGTLTVGASGVGSTNGGMLDVADGTVSVLGPSFTNNGTIRGGGTLDLSALQFGSLGGVLSPGETTGALTIKGKINSLAGRLQIELAGLTPAADYDRLAVTGSIQLAGPLKISLLNGFVPGPADTFMILTASSLGGGFTNAPSSNGVGAYDDGSIRFDVVYAPQSVTLTHFAVVPEPGTGTGWAGACLLLRRTRRRIQRRAPV